jgi:hypothetical protein
MAKSQAARSDEEAEREKLAAERRFVAIIRSVMAALGRPADFLKTTVRPVSGDSYRVNVMTGPNAGSARITHSYFVTADENGNVTHSTPVITKLY